MNNYSISLTSFYCYCFILFLLFLSHSNLQAQKDRASMLEELKITSEKCACTPPTSIEEYPSYVSFLHMQVPYHDFQSTTNLYLDSTKEEYKSLAYHNFISSNSRQQDYYSFDLLTYKDLNLTPLDNTIGIHFTPCLKEKELLSLPVEVNYSYKLVQRLRNFNYKKFEPSPKNYLKVLFHYFKLKEEELLGTLLYPEPLIVQDTLITRAAFLKKMNHKYGLALKEEDREEPYYYQFEFKKNKVDVLDFVLKEFIVPPIDNPQRDSVVSLRLRRTFGKWAGIFTMREVDRNMIPPKVSLSFRQNSYGLNLSNKVLRQWDLTKNKPLLDSNKQAVPTTILAESYTGLAYDYNNGFVSGNLAICMTPTELAGTGILLNFKEAHLTSTTAAPKLIPSDNYPLFFKDSIDLYKNNYYHQYDTLSKTYKRHYIYGLDKDSIPLQKFHHRYEEALTSFSGLFIPKMRLELPYTKKTKVVVLGEKVLLNNQMLTGYFVLEEPYFKLKERTLPIKKLVKKLKKWGIDATKVEIGSKQTKVHFKKMFP